MLTSSEERLTILKQGIIESIANRRLRIEDKPVLGSSLGIPWIPEHLKLKIYDFITPLVGKHYGVHPPRVNVDDVLCVIATDGTEIELKQEDTQHQYDMLVTVIASMYYTRRQQVDDLIDEIQAAKTLEELESLELQVMDRLDAIA